MMKKNSFFYLLLSLSILVSCNKTKTAIEILDKTISTIDTIETIYYKQDMSRTNPRNTDDTIKRHREMYFERLISDSIVGVKGHWYMYVNDKENVIFEDIYDGNKLIRKNNRDSVARIYDLVKYPGFKKKHFWSHNTLYGMQHEFKFIINNADAFVVSRLNDTILNNKACYQLKVLLEDKMTMPGFAIKLENHQGSISSTIYYIDKETFYPIRMKAENYSIDNPEKKLFIDQRYYDLKFNIIIDENTQFNTLNESIIGYEKKEMKPE